MFRFKIKGKCKTTTAVFLFLASYTVNWLFTCASFAVICWVLKQFGITSIANWTVAFDWKMGSAFWFIILFIRSLFSSEKE